MIKFLVNGVKPPKRNDGDAGFDFYVPNYSEEFVKRLKEINPELNLIPEKKQIILTPGQAVLIPSGVRTLIPHNIALVAHNKSGVATKQRLSVGACVVDHSYEGEIHLHVFNTSDKPARIDFGQKLIQFVPLVIDDTEAQTLEIPAGLTETEIAQFIIAFYKDHDSERGSGGFGSTGLN